MRLHSARSTLTITTYSIHNVCLCLRNELLNARFETCDLMPHNTILLLTYIEEIGPFVRFTKNAQTGICATQPTLDVIIWVT